MQCQEKRVSELPFVLYISNTQAIEDMKGQTFDVQCMVLKGMFQNQEGLT